MDFSQLCVEDAADVDGVWIDFAPGVRFKLRRLGCRAFDEAVQRRTKQMRKQIRDNTLTAEQLTDVQMYGLAHACILEWEGIFKDGTKEPLPYDPALGLKSMKTNYRMYKQVTQLCANLQEEEDNLEKEAQEN